MEQGINDANYRKTLLLLDPAWGGYVKTAGEWWTDRDMKLRTLWMIKAAAEPCWLSYMEHFTALTVTISDDCHSAEPSAPVRSQPWKKVTSYRNQLSHITSTKLCQGRGKVWFQPVCLLEISQKSSRFGRNLVDRSPIFKGHGGCYRWDSEV